MVHDAADVPEGPTNLDSVRVAFTEERLVSDAGLLVTATLAERLGIPWERVPGNLRETPFEVVEVIKNKRWKEVALRWRERDALVVAEAVGTAPLFALGRGAVGVHPLLRLTPPRVLEGIDPGMLLVGHGAPVETDAAASLRTALARSRSDIPRLLLSIPGAVRGRL